MSEPNKNVTNFKSNKSYDIAFLIAIKEKCFYIFVDTHAIIKRYVNLCFLLFVYIELY